MYVYIYIHIQHTYIYIYIYYTYLHIVLKCNSPYVSTDTVPCESIHTPVIFFMLLSYVKLPLN